MTQRRGLGRGLGALIPTAPTTAPEPVVAEPAEPAGGLETSGGSTGVDLRGPQPSPDENVSEPVTATSSSRNSGTHGEATPAAPIAGMSFMELSVDVVQPNPRQPRQVFDEDALAELVTSIQMIGLLQPIVVRPSGDSYELVAGERRLRATKLAGLATIPAFVRSTDDDAMLRDALLENLHRANLNPLEEAAAYQQLLTDFSCTQEVLAQRVGRSRPQVSNTLRLLRLPPTVQRRVAAGVLSAGHARALLGLSDPVHIEALAGRIVAEGLSVRAVEELVLLGTKDTPKPRSRAKRRETPVEYETAAERLADRLETRVRIEAGKTKGRIVVEFAAVEDLARIVELIEGSELDEGR